MRRIWLWLPLGLFVLFFAVVANGLINPADKLIMSKMIGKPAPQFSLAPAVDGIPGVGSANLKDGKAKLVKRRAYGYRSFTNYRLRLLNACASRHLRAQPTTE